eukprot:scaffold33605_cov106-Skeletonema_dohrnii-CCMP3373.AAC.1
MSGRGTSVRCMLLGQRQNSERQKSCLFISGRSYSIRYVDSEEEFNKFTEDLNSIKNTIAALNELHQNGQMTERTYRERLTSDWLDGCVAWFISAYGLNSVPNDVRAAINDVMNGLEIPLQTPWPAFEYVLLVPNDSVLVVHL